MKKIASFASLFIICAILVIVNTHLSSCTKTITHHDTTVLTIRDTTVLKDTIFQKPSTLSLLTGKQWEFDSVYSNYSGPGTGTLIYVRGASNNSQNLDNYYNTWTTDGYLVTYNNGSYLSYKWSFWSNDSVNYKAVPLSSGATNYGRILKLDATHLTFYDSTNRALDMDILTP